MDVIMTSPQVTYRVLLAGDKMTEYPRSKPELLEFEGQTCTYGYFSNPEDLPKPGTYKHIEEPIAKVDLITPAEYIGNLMGLAQDRRGVFKNQHFIDADRVILEYEIPLAELVGDFYDDLKSLSSGYASMSYEFRRYQKDRLEKLDIIVAGEVLEALSMMVHADRARFVGSKISEKLKDNIPKAQFSIILQAAIGANVIARETISSLRKYVTAKLYG